METCFNRLNTQPPEYLYRLRVRGHWRFWGNKERPAKSAAMEIAGKWLPDNRQVFLDAGCGHSPDALAAVQRLGFVSAVKVDLWPPYANVQFFADELSRKEDGRVRFVQGDICKLSDYVESASVDMISCNAVLDLLTAGDRDLFYEEAATVLRPGGILTISHVPLKAGHKDWKHGADERSRMDADAFEWLSCTGSTMVARRNAAALGRLPALALPGGNTN